MDRESFFEWLDGGPKFEIISDEYGTTTVKFNYEEPDDVEETDD